MATAQDIVALDGIDRKILRILTNNARASISEISEIINLSATPTIRRIKRLEELGIITGYHAHLNPHALGQDLLVFVEIKLQSKSGNIFEEFRREVLKVPQIMECHLVSGDFDYLLKTRVADMAAYRKLLGTTVLRLPGVNDTRTYVVMEEVKQTNYLVLK